MPTYSVRILRRYEEDYADVEVEAKSAKEAETKALKQAVTDADFLFDETPEPEFIVDPSMEPEKV